MHQDRHTILGVHITNRVKHAGEVQRLFTEHGCRIKTRIGLHDVDERYCAPGGLILLEVIGDPADTDRMVQALRGVEGVEVQQMVFDHP